MISLQLQNNLVNILPILAPLWPVRFQTPLIIL